MFDMVLTIASDKDDLQSQRDGWEHTTAYWLSREYNEMPIWIMAGVWSFVAGLALLLGVAAG